MSSHLPSQFWGRPLRSANPAAAPLLGHLAGHYTWVLAVYGFFSAARLRRRRLRMNLSSLSNESFRSGINLARSGMESDVLRLPTKVCDFFTNADFETS
jgi:hypothetical protein